MFSNLWTKVKSLLGLKPAAVVEESKLDLQQTLKQQQNVHHYPTTKPEIPPFLSDVIKQETAKMEEPKKTPDPANYPFPLTRPEEGEVMVTAPVGVEILPKVDKPKRRRGKPKAKVVAPAPTVCPVPAPVEAKPVEKAKKPKRKKKEDKGVCDLSTDKAKDGSSCGDRSAEKRPGGKSPK